MEVVIVEDIPNEDYVFRNIHCAQHKKWKAKRTPNESDFSLRPGEDGLSVNWDKYCSLAHAFILVGIQKDRNLQFRNPAEFKIIKLNIGEVRNLSTLGMEVDVRHDPLQDNKAHSLICYEDAEEIRLKLCDLVSNTEQPLLTIDFELINNQLEERRIAIG